ncbi:hypothetical protein [Pinibacter aurantiacus]|uniref:Uncharacterized protein n=1 Tax=Pinibacter aurantiacus TaxID=2851599 RepID=A0A9E2SCQ3_9BACT|nr:hypothetical protein [Pinibacter aurantiacus]MBV4359109.1 hypothetical protein [Pinibacter aurantiacus]
MKFEEKLYEACFTLVADLAWARDNNYVDNIEEYTARAGEMTKGFVEIAEKLYHLVDELPKSQAILIGAINYISRQSGSPSRSYYAWFENTLATLLRICNHDAPIFLEDLPFAMSMQQGLLAAMKDALDRGQHA